MADAFVPGAGRTVAWNDPAFGIQWPLPEQPILSPKDASCEWLPTSIPA